MPKRLRGIVSTPFISSSYTIVRMVFVEHEPGTEPVILPSIVPANKKSFKEAVKLDIYKPKIVEGEPVVRQNMLGETKRFFMYYRVIAEVPVSEMIKRAKELLNDEPKEYEFDDIDSLIQHAIAYMQASASVTYIPVVYNDMFIPFAVYYLLAKDHQTKFKVVEYPKYHMPVIMPESFPDDFSEKIENTTYQDYIKASNMLKLKIIQLRQEAIATEEEEESEEYAF